MVENQSAGRIGSIVVCMGRGESSRGCWKRLAGLGARRAAIDKGECPWPRLQRERHHSLSKETRAFAVVPLKTIRLGKPVPNPEDDASEPIQLRIAGLFRKAGP